MPSWLQTVVEVGSIALREALKARFLFKYIKDIGLLANKFRGTILKDFDGEYDVEVDEYGKKKTRAELLLERNPTLDKYLGRASAGVKSFLNFMTSPMVSRSIYVIGAAVGVGLAASNPVTLGLAIGGLAIVGASVTYHSVKDIVKFRKQKRLLHERAMLEEMLLLRQQCRAISESIYPIKSQTSKGRNAIYEAYGIQTHEQKNKDWKKHGKKRFVALGFAEQLPESLAPIVINIVTLNYFGLGVTIAGHFLEACGKSSRELAYARGHEQLLNNNIGLAEQLGIDGIKHGKQNADLSESLAEMRARRQALIKLKNGVKDGSIKPRETEDKFSELYQRELGNTTHTTEYKENTFWQDAKEVILKNGFSFAKTFRSFNPMINDYRNQYKTDVEPRRRAPSHEAVAQEAERSVSVMGKKDWQRLQHFNRSLFLNVIGTAAVSITPELKTEMGALAKRYKDKDFKKLCKMVSGSSSRDEISKQCEKLTKKLRDREKSSKSMKYDDKAIRLANKIKFVVSGDHVARGA